MALTEKRFDEAVSNKVEKAIRKALNVNDDIAIHPDNTLDDLSVDSLKIFDIMLSLEDIFDIDDIDELLKKQWTSRTKVREIIAFAKTTC